MPLPLAVSEIHYTLDNILELAKVLGNPQDRIPLIHITGTNGKGSVAALISTALIHGGYRVGRFTSPFLLAPNDSICINNLPIPHETFGAILADVKNYDTQNSCSLFEQWTMVAYEAFCRENCDINVIEVGMGGRLDATNIAATNLMSIFTMIGLDHQNFLGKTVELVAAEKSGIIRSGGLVIIGRQGYKNVHNVLLKASQEIGCNAIIVNEAQVISSGMGECFSPLLQTTFKPSLLGDFQLENMAIMITALDLLNSLTRFRIADSDILHGLTATRWPGRLERLAHCLAGGEFILDGAHNIDGAMQLRDFLDTYYSDHQLLWVIGMSETKDHRSILQALLRTDDQMIAVPFSVPEGMSWVQSTSPSSLERLARDVATVTKASSLDDALQLIRKMRANVTKKTLLVISGSLYLVADVYRLLALPV